MTCPRSKVEDGDWKAVEVVVAKRHNHVGTAGAAKVAMDMFSDRPPIDLEAL